MNKTLKEYCVDDFIFYFCKHVLILCIDSI